MDAATAGAGSATKKKRPLIVRLGQAIRRRLDPFLASHSTVGDTPYLDRENFPWIAELEANWETIRDEAQAMMRYREAIPPLNEISPDHKILAAMGKWRSFFMWAYGAHIDENIARCPKTAALVQRIPGMRTAMFSIHEPGMVIPPHEGVTKAICVLHLGLQTPPEAEKENCAIRVDGQVKSWADGEAFVFDDTRVHDTWNHTDTDRIILLVHFDRPMRFPASLIGKAFLTLVRYSPFIVVAKRNAGKWEQAFQMMETGGRD